MIVWWWWRWASSWACWRLRRWRWCKSSVPGQQCWAVQDVDDGLSVQWCIEDDHDRSNRQRIMSRAKDPDYQAWHDGDRHTLLRYSPPWLSPWAIHTKSRFLIVIAYFCRHHHRATTIVSLPSSLPVIPIAVLTFRHHQRRRGRRRRSLSCGNRFIWSSFLYYPLHLAWFCRSSLSMHRLSSFHSLYA